MSFFLGVPSAGQEEGGDRSQASTGGPAVHLPVWIRPVLRALGLPVLGSYYQQTDHSKTWQLTAKIDYLTPFGAAVGDGSAGCLWLGIPCGAVSQGHII